MAYLPPVEVEITGNTDGLVAAVARAKAALDSLKNSAGDIKIGAEVNAASIAKAAVATDALSAATNRNIGTGRRWTGWLAAAHTILTVFGANIVADTIGIIAFGIGAVSAFADVFSVIKNLGVGYGDLSNYQKAATVQLTAFKNQFDQLANPGIFAVVTGGLALIGSNLGKTGGIMDQATIAFENFIAMLRQQFASAPWQALFARSSGIIEKDLTALFGLINGLIGVIPALFHDFNSLGLWVINSTTAFLHLVAVLGNANPGLVRFAAVVFLVYRALRMLGQFNEGSLLMKGLSGVFGSLAFSAKDAGAALGLARTEGILPAGEALLGLGEGALAAVGGIGLGITAGIALAIALSGVKNQSNDIVHSLAQQDQAVGTNVAGYQKLASQLNVVVQHGRAVAGASQQMNARLNAVSQAQQQAAQTAQTLRGNLNYLEQTYHLTQAQAFQLAKATGTNLFSAFQKGGGAAQQARLKIAAYEQTVKAAQNPSTTLAYDLGLAANKALDLTSRVTALTNAFNALLTPFANVIQDTVTWKDGNITLKNAVDKAHGSVNDMGNRLQRLAAGDLATAINNTVKLSQDTLQQSGSIQKAIQPIQNEINVLQSLHSKSSEVAQAIRILQQYINSLHSKSITISTNFVTRGNAAPALAAGVSGQGRYAYASGTPSAARGWAWVGEKGPELMYMKGGETVIPNHALGSPKGYANGAGVDIAQPPINIYLDGQIIYKSVERRVYGKNMQNGVRNAHGGAQGRFGVR